MSTQCELAASVCRYGGTLRVISSNNVPTQVRTLIVPEVSGTMRDDFRRFWAVLFNLGDFSVGTLPKHT